MHTGISSEANFSPICTMSCQSSWFYLCTKVKAAVLHCDPFATFASALHDLAHGFITFRYHLSSKYKLNSFLDKKSTRQKVQSVYGIVHGTRICTGAQLHFLHNGYNIQMPPLALSSYGKTLKSRIYYGRNYTLPLLACVFSFPHELRQRRLCLGKNHSSSFCSVANQHCRYYKPSNSLQ